MIFICFTFSGSMPILNVFIFGGIFLIFWFHKKIFITYSGKCPSYSSEIIRCIIYTLKIIFLIHLFFSIVFISNKQVFPQNPNFSVTSYDLHNYTDGFWLMILIRLLKTLPLVILFGVSLVFFIS